MDISVFTCRNCSKSYCDGPKSPLALPCGDVFCRLCLVTIERKALSSNGKKKCPFCFLNWDQTLAKNLQIIKPMIPNSSTETVKPKTDEPPRVSSPTNYDDFMSNGKPSRDVLKCQDHEKEIEKWCNDHLCFLCGDCFGKHKSCSTDILNSKLKKLSSDLSDKEDMIKHFLSKTDDSLKSIDENISDLDTYISSLNNLKIDYEAYKKDIVDFKNVLQKGSKSLGDMREELLDNCNHFNIFENQADIICQVTRAYYQIGKPPLTPLNVIGTFMQGQMFYKSKKRKFTFPDDVKGFGYQFSDGKLQNIETGDPYEFNVQKNDHEYNQKRYEALGEVITDEVYKLLETECGLVRLEVPLSSDRTYARSGRGFVYASANWSTNEKLLLLINGSGVVRAGQWARRLIINKTLDEGTQIPYIRRALKDGFDVIVLNTNQKTGLNSSGKPAPISVSSSPERHAEYVWTNYVMKTKAKHIAIVAHSFGGVVTSSLVHSFTNEFLSKVFAVAFTDSVHSSSASRAFEEFSKITCNWASSSLPLDTPVTGYGYRHRDVKRVSAGVNSHELTSSSCIESVFKFFGNKLQEKVQGRIPKVPGEDVDTKNDEVTLATGTKPKTHKTESIALKLGNTTKDESSGACQKQEATTKLTRNTIQESENRTQESENRTQESENRTQESENRTQESENRTQESENRTRESENMTREPVDTTQKSINTTQESEDMDKESEDMDQESEDTTLEKMDVSSPIVQPSDSQALAEIVPEESGASGCGRNSSDTVNTDEKELTQVKESVKEKKKKKKKGKK